MNYEMLLLFILLLQWRVASGTSSPTLDDNMLPTDEEVLSDLINLYRGQPEQEIALNLPTDEEALNEIKPMLESGYPFSYTGGVEHFISSSFPEIDARGFHESVFDDLDDFYPISRRGKKYGTSSPIKFKSVHRSPSNEAFADFFHPVGKFQKSNDISEPSYLFHLRGKRSLEGDKEQKEKNFALKKSTDQNHSTQACTTRICANAASNSSKPFKFDFVSNFTFQNHSKSNITQLEDSKSMRQKRATHQQDLSRMHSKRKPEMTENGFHSDVFDTLNEFDIHKKWKLSNFKNNDFYNIADPDILIHARSSESEPEINKMGLPKDTFPNNFEKFHTAKRTPDMGQTGFHSDVFHQNFGNFDTLKRAVDMGQAGFHGDIFHSSFGNFNTLKRAAQKGGNNFHSGQNFAEFESLNKRNPSVDSKNFNNDAFNRDFGYFDTLRKRKREPLFPLKNDFNMDLFDRDFNNFYTGKRRSNPGAVNGDAFHSSFGIFETLKKRRPQGELSGDAFHSSFGNFDTMKRTIGGDAFHSQFGKFETMKRNPSRNSDSEFARMEESSIPWMGSQRGLNNNVEVFYKIRPHRFDKLRHNFPLKTQDESNYEKFRTFIRNYAFMNQFDDMSKRLHLNETEVLSNLLNNNASVIH